VDWFFDGAATMFWHIKLERNIVLEPRFFGRKLRDTLMQRLKHEVEGSCTGKHGYIVMVTDFTNISEGMVTDDGTARAKFRVEFDAIAFRPFKGQVLDAVVTEVNKFGFFAEAGPMNLFVSNQLISDDMKFESIDNANRYVSSDKSVSVQKNGEVRVRVVGMRIDAQEIFCVATMKEDYLGAIDQDAGADKVADEY